MYSDALRQAWEARQKAIAEHRSILDGIGEEPTAEQSSALDKVEGELRRLDDVIEQGLDNVEREARFQEAIEKHGFAHRETPEIQAEASDEMRQVEAFLRGETRSIDFMPEVRSIGTGSGEGAATVPTSMFSEIVAGMREFSNIQNYARVITTASGEEITVPKRNTYPAAALVAEKGTFGTSEGSYSSIALNAYKFGFISQASVELLADSGFDMAAEIAAVGAEAMALGMDSYFWTGTGSSQPEGVLQNSTTTKTLAGVAAVTADELIETVHAITRPYRQNARFYMNDATVLAVRKLKDSNNNYLWAPSRILGEPDTLLGYAVESEANLDAMATGVKSIVFGDLGKGLIVRLAGGVNVTRSDEYGFSSDLVSWKWGARADSAIVDAAAYVVVSNA